MWRFGGQGLGSSGICMLAAQQCAEGSALVLGSVEFEFEFAFDRDRHLNLQPRSWETSETSGMYISMDAMQQETSIVHLALDNLV